MKNTFKLFGIITIAAVLSMTACSGKKDNSTNTPANASSANQSADTASVGVSTIPTELVGKWASEKMGMMTLFTINADGSGRWGGDSGNAPCSWVVNGNNLKATIYTNSVSVKWSITDGKLDVSDPTGDDMAVKGWNVYLPFKPFTKLE